MNTFFDALKRALPAFRPAQGGNVAITFALVLLPLVAAVGAAIDYSRANSVRADLQASLDSTALMLAKEAANDTSDELQTNAAKYFKATFNRPDTENVTVSATYSDTGESTVLVKGSVELPAEFMQIFGFDYFTIGSTSTASWGNLKLRVALVLDNTGSMAQNGKIAALKTATKSMLSTLQTAATNDGDVEVAIIPFANGVDVGTGNVSDPWIDWTYYSNSGGWDGYGGGYGSYSGSYSGGGSDSWGSNTWSSGSGSWGSSNNWQGQYGTKCTWSTCWQSTGSWSTSSWSTSTSHWQGCVTDRDQDYDVLNTAPDTSNKSTLFPAIYATSCPVAVMGLSSDWSAMDTLVDSMNPTGSTNQTIGLAWGWEALTEGGPFDNPAMPSDAQQVIVMLTDGLNTENRWSTNQSDIDARTEKVCANIKAAGITLYTIQVDTSGDPTSTLLQDCASDSSKFFLLTSADQINTVFDQIANDLKQLRIAK